MWKAEVQRRPDRIGISIHLGHFQGGHQQVEQDRAPTLLISINRRGRPLRTHETTTSLIGVLSCEQSSTDVPIRLVARSRSRRCVLSTSNPQLSCCLEPCSPSKGESGGALTNRLVHTQAQVQLAFELVISEARTLSQATSFRWRKLKPSKPPKAKKAAVEACPRSRAAHRA